MMGRSHEETRALVCANAFACPCRILKPTELASTTSTVTVYLLRSTLATGVLNWVRMRSTVLWPHELWAALWQFHPGAFRQFILGGDPSNVETFWRSMPRRACMEGRQGCERFCVPIALHGDGVAVAAVRGAAAKTADVISWTSLLASGATRYTTYLVWFVFNHLTKKVGFGTTWASFWRRFVESLRALWLGTWPDTNMSGEPDPKAGQWIAGGYFGIIYINRGDLDWMASHFHLANVSSRRPCSLCRCTNLGTVGEQFPWTDVNYPPVWETTCITDEACIMHA